MTYPIVSTVTNIKNGLIYSGFNRLNFRMIVQRNILFIYKEGEKQPSKFFLNECLQSSMILQRKSYSKYEETKKEPIMDSMKIKIYCESNEKAQC